MNAWKHGERSADAMERRALLTELRLHAILSAGEESRALRIKVSISGNACVLTSSVPGASNVERTNVGRAEYARLVWQRNADTDIVTLGFDRRDRIAGVIRHPAQHFDHNELELYLRVP